MSRLLVAVAAAAFAFSASPAVAQDKKPVPPDVQALKADLEKLRAMQAEIEAQLKKLGAETELKRAQELLGQKDKIIRLELEKALKFTDDRSKLAQVEEELAKGLKLKDEYSKLAQVEFEKAIKLKEGQDKPKVVVLDAGGKQHVPYEKMTPEELKQVITKLQMLLEEKTRNAEREKRIEKVKPGGVSNDEIMKRLDILTMQVEELRRAIKK